MIAIKERHQYIELWGADPATIAHAEKLRKVYGYRVILKPLEREFEQNQTIGNLTQKHHVS